MTDSDPQLPPEQENAVRRLLTEARANEPMPGDVAERLDGVLSDLDAESPAPVSPLDARRRRRRAVSLVLAAAVVVIASVGVGQLIRDTGDGADTLPADSASDEGGSRQGELERAQQPEALDGDAGSADAVGPALALPRELPIARVSRESFADDARRIRAALPDRESPPVNAFRRLDTGSLPERLVAPRSRLDCVAAPWGPGVLVPLVFDGQATVLAFRPATGDTQVVDVLQCGSGQTLHSTTLPAG